MIPLTASDRCQCIIPTMVVHLCRGRTRFAENRFTGVTRRVATTAASQTGAGEDDTGAGAAASRSTRLAGAGKEVLYRWASRTKSLKSVPVS